MNLFGLRRIQLFQSLHEKELDLILSISTVRDIPADSVIFREGDESDRVLVILQGEIDIVKYFGTEVERLVNTLGEGDFLGELSIVSNERRRTASAVTQSGAQVLEIPVPQFDLLIRQNAELAYELMKVMVRRLRETETTAIQELKEKNRQLTQSLQELKNAQAQLIAQEKYESELSTARTIQESMLPEKIPVFPGWQLFAHWQPAQSVSGDFYDFFSLADGKLALMVGDVSGKGVPAALIMTVTRSMLRASAISAATPGDLLAQVNDLLCAEIPLGMFVTCHISFLDLASGEITYASAGHCRPLHRRAGKVCELPAKGIALGVFPDFSYQNFQIRVEPGDSLLLYSDGLFEAHNQDGQMMGLDSIQEVFTSSIHPVEGLLDHLANFTGSKLNPEDDITLLHLEREIC
ncbi:MAG: SpoIIE family protein phosphatase [Anaerolineaceae bacterium]|nr:SpoIIE family protein phosphatase [Anaerolineaceae bacterium]